MGAGRIRGVSCERVLQVATVLGFLACAGTAVAVSPIEEWVAISPGGGGDPTAHLGSYGSYWGLNTDVPAKRALALDAAGNTYITGSVYNGFDSDFLTRKIAPDGSVLWSATYSGHDEDFAYALALDSAGNVVVTGTSLSHETYNDYVTVKYAGADGTQLWMSRYDGSAGSSDGALAIAVDSADNVVVTGQSIGNGTGFDYVTVKYAGTDGAQVWVSRYNGPANATDVAAAIVVDDADNVIVTGRSAGGGTGEDHATVKYAGTNGAQLWERRTSNASCGMAVDSADDVIVVGGGSARKYAGVDGEPLWVSPAYGSDCDVAVDSADNVVVADGAAWKFAGADGAQLWVSDFIPGFWGGAVYAVAVDDAGDVVVTGKAVDGDGNSHDYDYATVKYSGVDGTQQWKRRYNGPGNDEDIAYAVAVDGAGDIRVAGNSYGLVNEDIRVVAYASDGVQLWDSGAEDIDDVFVGLLGAGSPEPNRRGVLAVDAAGNTFVTGSVSDGRKNSYHYLTRKFAPDGSLLWSAIYKGPGGGYDQAAYALALDSAGDVVVTGRSRESGAGGVYTYATVKYSGTDGTQQWVSRHAGPDGDFGTAAYSVAVDSKDDVVVTGQSGSDYLTVKYSGADGTQQWESRYDGTGNGFDGAYALAIDSADDVVVTGRSPGSDSGLDYATVKYSGADGTQLWISRYNGPGNHIDEAYTIALDSADNVVVAGKSRGHGVVADNHVTVKYAAADGAQQWVSRYGDVEHMGYGAYAVVVDSADNVVVTGQSWGLGSKYATVKYAGGDGARLWVAHYGGPASDPHMTFDLAYDVALDSADNVVVTGRSTGDGTGDDYATVKYAGVDGSLLWAHRYDGTSGYDWAYAVKVASDDSVRVAGIATPPEGVRVVVIKLVESAVFADGFEPDQALSP